MSLSFKGKKMTTQNNIQERALLSHLKITMWRATKLDKSTSRETCNYKKAAEDAANVIVKLIPKVELEGLVKKRHCVRKVWLRYTLPWLDDGVRILPSAVFKEYSDAMRLAIADFENEIELFLKRYPKLVANPEIRLGDFLQTNQLPTIDEIRNKFGIKQTLLPVPDAEDFRVDCDQEVIEQIKKDATNAIKATTAKAVETLWKKMSDMLSKINDTLSQKDKGFHETLIGNLREFCELLPKLNLNKDSELESLRLECVKKLTGLSPDNLKTNKLARKKASNDAKDILNKLKGYKTV